MLKKYKFIYKLYLIIWLNINICVINAFDIQTTENCYGELKNSGSKTLVESFDGLINSANKWKSESCSDESYQVKIEKGNYVMEEQLIERRELVSSFYEPDIVVAGISLLKLKKNIEFVGEVDEETNEILTVFECPRPGSTGFVDVIYTDRNVSFKNIKFTNCYGHWFKITHFAVIDDHIPEYRFDNCLFEDNYNESLILYQFFGSDNVVNGLQKIGNVSAQMTTKMLIFRITNSTFRNNKVWNREICKNNYTNKSDCYYKEDVIDQLNNEDKNSGDDKRKSVDRCLPSNSEHGSAAIAIIAPLYNKCSRFYGGCNNNRENSFFVKNSIFESNTGGDNGLFSFKCIGAVFEDNVFNDNWGLESGLININEANLHVSNDQIKNQHSSYGDSTAIYQLTYSDLVIRGSTFEDIESQTSSVVNIKSSSTAEIFDSTFIKTILPFEVDVSGSSIICTRCTISEIERKLSKKRPTIAENTGDSYMKFVDSEIYDIFTMPMFKTNERSLIDFINVKIHGINSISHVGLIDIITSAKVGFYDSNIYDINYKRVLDNGSFIKFESSGSLIFNNTNVYDSSIDGNFASIIGIHKENDEDKASLVINNSKFYNINIRTGSIFEIDSLESNFQIINSKFIENIKICNIEDDKENCPGIILIKKGLEESTIDTCDFNSNRSGIGPAITIYEVENINLNIQNSKFRNNEAISQGGALYISGLDEYSNNQIKMRNLEFVKNHANSGGAMLISYNGYNEETIENCSFINNTADNGGGVFYFPINGENNKPNCISCTFENNDALFGVDYSTNPKRIKFNNTKSDITVYSGQPSQAFKFIIEDGYGNLINTAFDENTFSLQNMVFIQLLVYEKEDIENLKRMKKRQEDINSSNSAQIVGETFGYFQNGICTLNAKFFQEENINKTYILRANVAFSGYSDDTSNLYTDINLHMKSCPLGLVPGKTSESKFLGCIQAKCDEEHRCEEDKGFCVSDNKCQCYNGYEGITCHDKIYFSLNMGIRKYSMVLSLVGIILSCLLCIFLAIKRNSLVVKMSKLGQLSIIALGCIFGFWSIIFDFRKVTRYTCTAREIFMNIGFILIYSIFYLKMFYYIINNVPENLSFSMTNSSRSQQQSSKGGEAGQESSMKVSKFEMSLDVRSGFNFTSTTNQGNDLIKQTDQTKREIQSIANNIFRKQYIDGLKKSFYRIYGFVLILFVVSLVIVTTFNLKDDIEEEITPNSGFAKMCESKTAVVLPYSLHIIFLLILFGNIRKCWSLSTMYAETKHICFALILWLTTGPLIQLICVTMIKSTPKLRFLMMIHSVFISHFFILFWLLGMKAIAIIKGDGESTTYNSKLKQFYNEPSCNFNNNNNNNIQSEASNSYKQ